MRSSALDKPLTSLLVQLCINDACAIFSLSHLETKFLSKGINQPRLTLSIFPEQVKHLFLKLLSCFQSVLTK